MPKILVMKKNAITLVLFVFISASAFSQKKYENVAEPKGFQRSNLFTGGSLALSLGSGYTSVGLNPYLGYSFAKWLDAAVSLNYNYTSQRDYYVTQDKIRQSIVGPGAFVRLFPVKFLYAQAQYEHNFMSQKYIPPPGYDVSYPKVKIDVNSLLVGAGYASGREAGKNTYYYFSVMFDVLKDPNSPYTDRYGRAIPVLKAGVNIGLFQKDRY